MNTSFQNWTLDAERAISASNAVQFDPTSAAREVADRFTERYHMIFLWYAFIALISVAIAVIIRYNMKRGKTEFKILKWSITTNDLIDTLGWIQCSHIGIVVTLLFPMN